jgi:hypothetical protein
MLSPPLTVSEVSNDESPYQSDESWKNYFQIVHDLVTLIGLFM